MNTTRPATPAPSLPLTVACQIDDVCGEFEAAWRADARPDVAAFADRVPAGRSTLLRELIRLDIHYRRKAGETATADECCLRFPDLDPAAVTADDDTVTDPRPRPGSSPDPDCLLNGHELLGELGRGGMGVVYKARHVGLNRIVALKMLRAADFASPAEVYRFRVEAEAVARLQHPNIVPIFEVGECVPPGSATAGPYFSLEYAPGGTLAAKYDRAPQPARAAAATVEALARAVHHAHEKGVVHRDLKPANVLLTADGTPKITDFGLAKLLDGGDDTRTGAILGTPAYMAPEQADGRVREIGPRTDVYALGCILYEALTGHPPFRGQNTASTLAMVRTQEPVPPRHLLPTVPRDLEVIALKCLEKDARKRYATAADLADDLRRFAEGRPIVARPVGRGERAWKFVRRRPWQSAFAGLAVVSLLAGIVGTSVGMIEARRERDEADEARRAAVAAEQRADGKRIEAETAREAEAKQTAVAEAKRAEAEAERRIADKRVAEALVTVSFFERRLLAAARPKGQEGGLGKDVTLREAIMASLPDLAAEFANHPRVEAVLRHSLGKTLGYLGDTTNALAQMEQSLALYRKVGGPDDPETLRAAHNLALAYESSGRHTDALTLREDVLDRRTRVLTADHPDVLSTMDGLASSYARVNRREDALELREKVLAARRRVLPKDDPQTLRSAHNLAISYFAAGRREEALKLNEEVLEARRRILPNDHPDTLTTMGNLAVCIAAVPGREEEGLTLHLETLAARRRVFPKGHERVLDGLWSVSHTLCALRRSAEAIPYIDECLRGARNRTDVSPKMVPELLDLRLRHFAQAHDPAGCRATAVMWEELKRTEAEALYLAACCRAVAAGVHAVKKLPAESKADADKAMEWLAQAVLVGFNDRKRLDVDGRLLELRERDDFKKLLADLTKKGAAPQSPQANKPTSDTKDRSGDR